MISFTLEVTCILQLHTFETQLIFSWTWIRVRSFQIWCRKYMNQIMEQSPSWEVDFYAFHGMLQSPPLGPLLSQRNPIQAISFCLFSHISIIIPSTRRSSQVAFFLQVSPTNPCVYRFSYPFITCHMSSPSHFPLLVTLVIFCQEYKSKSCIFPLCNTLHSPVTCYRLGPVVICITRFSNILSLCP